MATILNVYLQTFPVPMFSLKAQLFILKQVTVIIKLDCTNVQPNPLSDSECAYLNTSAYDVALSPNLKQFACYTPRVPYPNRLTIPLITRLYIGFDSFPLANHKGNGCTTAQNCYVVFQSPVLHTPVLQYFNPRNFLPDAVFAIGINTLELIPNNIERILVKNYF
ncbi:MAG: hypothetical protein GY861_05945 [bacterium]|nr:hypothetical protein [bacterium]